MSLKARTSHKVSARELPRSFAVHVSQIEMLHRELGLIETEETKLCDRKSKLIGQLRKEERSAIMAQEKLLVVKPLSRELVRARNSFLSVAGKAQSRDIKIRQKAVLEEKAQKLLLALRSVCDHRFVLEYDGYGGSSSYDYDDHYCGSHVCMVCGLSEQSKTTREQIYDVLVQNETRLVKRDLREDSGPTLRERLFDEINLVPVLHIRKIFLASAGCPNIE